MGTSSNAHPTEVDPCPVCESSPVVLVALRHQAMRQWTDDLLESVHGCWTVSRMSSGELLADAIARTRPDLVVVDEVDFPSCCQAALDGLSADRVIVVGPEPDAAYRSLALQNGAGGWVSRERVVDELSAAMRAALGCRHDPCPPLAALRGASSATRSHPGGLFR